LEANAWALGREIGIPASAVVFIPASVEDCIRVRAVVRPRERAADCTPAWEADCPRGSVVAFIPVPEVDYTRGLEEAFIVGRAEAFIQVPVED
jgi:hypothetical protein